MPQYENKALEEAAKKFREKPDPNALIQVATTFMLQPVYVPIGLEKEPETDENGNFIIDESHQPKMIAVKTKDGKVFFPVFSTPQQARNFYKEQEVMLIPLAFRQYMPMIEAAKDEVEGLVVDPAGANVPFKYPLLKGMMDSMRKNQPKADPNRRVNPARINRGQKIHLRNPEGRFNDLEAALISSGFHEQHINKIFLKERLPDLDKPEETHWFVVVDSSENDPKIFERIAELCKDALHGKEMEFIFTNQKLGKDIAASSKPLYEKSEFMI